MKTLFLSALVSILSHQALAGELQIFNGAASARRGANAAELVERAKEDAQSKIATKAFRQVSKWSTYVVVVGPEVYAGAEASFVDSNDPGPYFVTSTENRSRTWDRSEVPHWIQFSKTRAESAAAFYCNSVTEQTSPWDVKIGEAVYGDGPNNTSYNIETSARFQCL